MKKKDIIIVTLFLLIALLASVIIYFYFEGKNNKNLSNKTISMLDSYKNIKVEDIESIEYITGSQVQKEPLIITNSDKIKEVYDKLGEIKIKEKTDLSVTDSDLIIRINTKSDIVSYHFEESILLLDKTRYETSGLYDLKVIIN
ncbi:MAG: hypothetical protein IJ568_07490 [Bacilli bacterium]|nr:hypothetical protein [Bacilli bacterium]